MDYTSLAPALLVEKDGPVRILTMNRPEELNSVDDALHSALRRVWGLLIDDEDARAVVLTGAGRAFCSGGYLPNFIRNSTDAAARRKDIREAERLAYAMLACDLPIVAAVNGPAVGLGCSLTVMSDLVVMADDTFLADPHVTIGLVAGDGGAVTWPAMMSLLKAKEYILLGDRIPAVEAERLGMVNRLVPRDQVLAEAMGLARRLADQPVQALQDTKRALNKHLIKMAHEVLGFALSTEEVSFTTDDVANKVKEFMAKDQEKKG